MILKQKIITIYIENIKILMKKEQNLFLKVLRLKS